MIATSERVGGRGRVRCCVALALGLACDRSGGAAIDAPAQAAPTGAADPSALETPVDAAVPATPRRPTSTGWTVEHDELGTLRIRNRNADVVRTSYAFFEAGYRWADTDIRLTRTSGDADAIDAIEAALEIAALGVRGTSRLTLEQTETTATATLRWQLSLSRHVVDVSGGGLDLRGALVPALWGGKAPVADVSADGRQLTVGRGDSALRFELDGDAAAFSMLPGMPGVVRLVLLAGTIERGTRQVTMRVTLPAGGQIATASAARHPVPGPSWSGPALVHDAWPVDLSFLQDAPAGKHGHVRADGESLVFADGTPARFWGTNLSAYALFERDKAAIARQARRISAMGFNLVRLHHHDSGWVTPNIFEPGSRRLRKESLESLDWWIKCLSDEGIYIWLDLHVGRVFTAKDGIGGFAELVDGDGRGFSYVNPRITALMDEFAAAYLGRRNIHTGRTIASDPAVAMVLVTNENDLSHHFASRMDPGSNAPIHEALLRSRVERFAARSKISVEAALRVWEPGPAKLALAEIEHEWSAAAIGRLRKLGVRAPVVSTSLWGDEALYSVPSLVAGDAIDVHSYGLPETLATNPHFEANFVIHAATGAVLGKPHTLSEYSVPPPALDRYIGPTYVAAIAALQGWDAPLLYSYAHEAGRPSRPQQFSAWLDPSLMGLMPAAALIYRRQDVAPARKRIVVAPSAKQVFGESRNAVNSAALRTGVEQSQVVIAMPDAEQLAWDTTPDLTRQRRLGATVITDLDRDLLAADATEIVSDTGELRRDFIEGRHIVSTPRSQVASGWIGGATIELGDGWVALDNPGATFALSSLDGEPIAASKKILVTAVGPSVPMTAERAEFRAAPIRGRFAVRNAVALELVPLATGTGSSGGKLGGRVAIAGKREGDLQVFTFDGKANTHWWILRPAP